MDRTDWAFTILLSVLALLLVGLVTWGFYLAVAEEDHGWLCPEGYTFGYEAKDEGGLFYGGHPERTYCFSPDGRIAVDPKWVPVSEFPA